MASLAERVAWAPGRNALTVHCPPRGCQRPGRPGSGPRAVSQVESLASGTRRPRGPARRAEREILCGQGRREGLLVQRVQLGLEHEHGGEPLHQRSKVTSFGQRERSSVAAVGVAVAEPLLEYGIASQIEAPDTFRYIRQVDLLAEVKVACGGAPFRRGGLPTTMRWAFSCAPRVPVTADGSSIDNPFVRLNSIVLPPSTGPPLRAGFSLRVRSNRPVGQGMQDVDRPAHIQALPQPARACRPRMQPESQRVVLRPELLHRIGGHRGRRRDFGQGPAVRPHEPERAVGLPIDLVALLVDRAVVSATEQCQVRQRGRPPLRPVAKVMPLAEGKPAAREPAGPVPVVKRAP